jgi:protein-S-isoprenylcysteine O-methyltransferase Ste14
MLAGRAILAFLLLPGVVAGLVPWLLHPVGVRVNGWGGPPIGVGLAVLIWCVRDWAIAFHSVTLAVYGVVVAILFHLRVKLVEEPTLARLYGEDWTHYSTSVRRWL